MVDLWPLLNFDYSMVLLIAPPAWGKTRMLIKMFKQERRKMIYLSPLRALANEFYQNFQDYNNVFLLVKRICNQEILEKFLAQQHAMLITTPEMLTDNQLNLCFYDKGPKPIVIIDEFHLFYYWAKAPCVRIIVIPSARNLPQDP